MLLIRSKGQNLKTTLKPTKIKFFMDFVFKYLPTAPNAMELLDFVLISLLVLLHFVNTLWENI